MFESGVHCTVHSKMFVFMNHTLLNRFFDKAPQNFILILLIIYCYLFFDDNKAKVFHFFTWIYVYINSTIKKFNYIQSNIPPREFNIFILHSRCSVLMLFSVFVFFITCILCIFMGVFMNERMLRVWSMLH